MAVRPQVCFKFCQRPPKCAARAGRRGVRVESELPAARDAAFREARARATSTSCRSGPASAATTPTTFAAFTSRPGPPASSCAHHRLVHCTCTVGSETLSPELESVRVTGRGGQLHSEPVASASLVDSVSPPLLEICAKKPLTTSCYVSTLGPAKAALACRTLPYFGLSKPYAAHLSAGAIARRRVRLAARLTSVFVTCSLDRVCV